MIIRYPSSDPICVLREEAIAAQVDIFRSAADAESAGTLHVETDEDERLHRAFHAVWRRLPWWARIGVWQQALHRHDR